MDDIKDVKLVECEKSNYIKPLRAFYTQNGKKKAWDAMKVHDRLYEWFKKLYTNSFGPVAVCTDVPDPCCLLYEWFQKLYTNSFGPVAVCTDVPDPCCFVAILIYNSSRNVFVLVKQFRAAVYISSAKTITDESGTVTIDHTKYPGSIGLTYELCAGIVDKDKSVEEIAQEEILEECGYKVSTDRLHRITGFRLGVGTSAAYQNMFYVDVTDDMKVSSGGGNQHEGELIDIVEIPLSEGKTFIMDESKTKPIGVLFAIMWFYENIKTNKL